MLLRKIKVFNDDWKLIQLEEDICNTHNDDVYRNENV